MNFRISVEVPRSKTKSVKVALENGNLLAKDVKITPSENGCSLTSIPTCLTSKAVLGTDLEEAAREILCLLNDAVPEIGWDIDSLSLRPLEPSPSALRGCNVVQAAMLQASSSSSGDDKVASEGPPNGFLMRLGKTYCIYPPMLLLSAGRDSHLALNQLSRYNISPNTSLKIFLSSLAQSLNVTHIALNAPIPRSISDSQTTSDILRENCIRSPVRLQPLYGDFGPVLAPFPEHKPSSSDFTQAFWVHVRQNGVTQIWAPYYTMFSAGNVTEKARIIELPSVQRSVADGIADGQGCTAVDLFAGIGYFAFSYLNAGVSKVVCWDLNPWSVEGLRRGALANKWPISVHEGMALDEAISPDVPILAFRESNEYAAKRIMLFNSALPPIRHVNCGMLPSSGEAWKTAVDVIDPTRGGWIHLHESILIKSLELRIDSIINEMKTYAASARGVDPGNLHLDHVEKVKTVGPGLVHVVLDIAIPPVLICK